MRQGKQDDAENSDDEGDQEDEEEKDSDEVDDEGEAQVLDAEAIKVPSGKGQSVDVAICLDAVGQNRAFTESEVDIVKRWARVLAEAYKRTELSNYEREYRTAYATKKQREEQQEQLQEKLEELRALEEEEKEKVRAF